jgi:hypothetical protein
VIRFTKTLSAYNGYVQGVRLKKDLEGYKGHEGTARNENQQSYYRGHAYGDAAKFCYEREEQDKDVLPQSSLFAVHTSHNISTVAAGG